MTIAGCRGRAPTERRRKLPEVKTRMHASSADPLFPLCPPQVWSAAAPAIFLFIVGARLGASSRAGRIIAVSAIACSWGCVGLSAHILLSPAAVGTLPAAASAGLISAS